MDQNIEKEASVMVVEEEEEKEDLTGVDHVTDEVDGQEVVTRRRRSMWRVFGKRVPKEEIVFGSQIFVVLIVVLASIYNLSVGDDTQSELWTALLSSCLGYILPNPRLKGD